MALDLGKQVGPLPLGAWMVAVGGGLAILVYSRSHGSSANSDPILADDTSVDPGVGVGGVGAYTPTDGGAGGILGTQTLTSNAQWSSAAFNYLVSMGTEPTTADTAIRNYLQGISLTLAQNAMIALALARFGQPPEGLPVAPTLPDAPVQTTPTNSGGGGGSATPVVTPSGSGKKGTTDNYQPYKVIGSYQTAAGGVNDIHTVQPYEQAQLTLGADGLYHNQWGNTFKGVDQYGSPIA